MARTLPVLVSETLEGTATKVTITYTHKQTALCDVCGSALTLSVTLPSRSFVQSAIDDALREHGWRVYDNWCFCPFCAKQRLAQIATLEHMAQTYAAARRR